MIHGKQCLACWVQYFQLAAHIADHEETENGYASTLFHVLFSQSWEKMRPNMILKILFYRIRDASTSAFLTECQEYLRIFLHISNKFSASNGKKKKDLTFQH